MTSMFAMGCPQVPAINIIVRTNCLYAVSIKIDTAADYSYSPCLASRLGDSGLAHSPVYGFSTDGYPIYGPFQASGVVAISCWQRRDYSSSSVVGCASGARTCILKNPLDFSQGKQTVSAGPSLSSTLSTSSGNVISSASGIYKQDYFYNAS